MVSHRLADDFKEDWMLTFPSLDMREHFAIDPLIGKRQQLLLATQLCRMVLKVCFNLYDLCFYGSLTKF